MEIIDMEAGNMENGDYDCINRVHRTLFDRSIDPEQARSLFDLGVLSTEEDSRVARRMLMLRERREYPCGFSVRFQADDLYLTTVDAGFEMFLDKHDRLISRHIAVSGTADHALAAFFSRVMTAGMHVVDVGANIGFFTLLAAKMVGPAGRVTSFEPNSENCRMLILSVQRNGFQNVKLIPAALGSSAGYATFTTGLGTNGSFVKDDLFGDLCVLVPTLKMDDVVKDQVDFIKMDVEGAEPLVVAGAAKIIRKHRPLISSEFCPFMLQGTSGTEGLAFINRFLSLGYRVARLRDNGEEEDIENVQTFLNLYGSPHEICELIFRPLV